MSAWTHIDGRHNSKRVSIRKLVDLVWDGKDYIFDKQENGQEFCFQVESEGIFAAKRIEKFCEEFKRLDKNARLYMVASINFSV